MFKKVAIGLVVVVAVLVAVISSRPDTFRVERSTTIAAPPEVVFGFAQDMREVQKWNPWAKVDPAMKATFSGPQSGVGAAYEWNSEKIGAGRQEISEVKPNELVKMKLDFTAPMEAHNTVEYALKPAAGGTTFTWAMHGESNFGSKAMGLFFSMDEMVGGEFEKGLTELKTMAEAEAKRRAEAAANAGAPAVAQ